MKEDEIKGKLKEGFAKIVRDKTGFCLPRDRIGGKESLAENYSKVLGYSLDELPPVPDGINLGLGCGNPVALASLQEGELVVDLGSGAGLDCILAAQKVGPTGKVIAGERSAI